MDKDQPTAILATPDPFLLAIAKSLLDGADIFYTTQGEALQEFVAPGRIGGFNTVAGSVQLIVRAEDAEIANELLADLKEPPSLKNA